MKLSPILSALVVCVCLCFFSALPVRPVSAASSTANGLTTTNLVNPIANAGQSGATDIRIFFGRILQQALAVIGSITLLVFIIGGAYWLISAGNAERVKKGTDTMVWAVIGLFVVFGAYGILGTVIQGLTGKSLDSPQESAPQSVIVYYGFEGQNVSIKKEPTATSQSISLAQLNGSINCIAVYEQDASGYSRIEDPNNAGSFGWVESTYLTPNPECATKKAPASNGAYTPKNASATACGCTGGIHIKPKGLGVFLASECTMSIDKTNKVQIPYGTKTTSQDVLKLVLEKGPQNCRDLIKQLDNLPSTALTVDAYGCEQSLPQILASYKEYNSSVVEVTHTLTCAPL